MKIGCLGLFLILIGSISGSASTQVSKMRFSAVDPIELRILVQGQPVRVKTSVQKGASQNWVTVRVYRGKKQVQKSGLSSLGGMHYAHSDSRQELIVWDYLWAEKEAHFSDHYYVVLTYQWLSADRLVPTLYYRTTRKYSYEANEAAYQEFLTHRPEAVKVLGLQRRKLVGQELAALEKVLVKKIPRMPKIKHGYLLGPWAIVTNWEKGSLDNSEQTVWEKSARGWRILAEGVESWDSKEVYNRYHIPVPWFLWQRLTYQFWK